MESATGYPGLDNSYWNRAGHRWQYGRPFLLAGAFREVKKHSETKSEKRSSLTLHCSAGEAVRSAFLGAFSRVLVQFSLFVSFLRGEPKPKVRI